MCHAITETPFNGTASSQALQRSNTDRHSEHTPIAPRARFAVDDISKSGQRHSLRCWSGCRGSFRAATMPEPSPCFQCTAPDFFRGDPSAIFKSQRRTESHPV